MVQKVQSEIPVIAQCILVLSSRLRSHKHLAYVSKSTALAWVLAFEGSLIFDFCGARANLSDNLKLSSIEVMMNHTLRTHTTFLALVLAEQAGSGVVGTRC